MPKLTPNLRLVSRFAVVATMLLLVGCGAGNDPYTVTEAETRARPVHSKLEVHVSEFARHFRQPMGTLNVTIGPLEDGVAGKCFIPGGKPTSDQIADAVFGDSTQPNRRVVISAKYFAKHKDNFDAIQNVVFHELSHCLLTRGHTTTKIESSLGFGEIPKSIMFPSSFGDRPYYRAHFDEYVRELFDPEMQKAGLSARAQDPSQSPDHGNCVEYVDEI